MTKTSFRRAALRTATTATILLGAGAAHAGAFYLQDASVKGAGRAYSGEGADQGAESLWWNPASIAGNESSTAYLGATLIVPRGKVRNVNTLIRRPGATTFSPVGGRQVSNNPINKGVAPSGAVAWKLNDQFALGLAITSPFSFTTNYEPDSWVRYTADKTKLRTIDLQPSIAFAPSPVIGIGVGLNIEYAKATLNNALPNLSPLQPDGQQTLKGDGWDFGYTVGVQLHPSSMIDLGVSYKSSIKHKLKGDVTISGLLAPIPAANNFNVDAEADFRTPWQLIGSARVHVTDKLTLNGQVVRFGWNKFDAINISISPIPLPQNYRNSWSFAGGLDYAVTPQWTLRSGIQRDTTPTRDGERDARVPDGNRWNFAAGTSYKLSNGITLDAAANYLTISKSSIDRTTAAFPGTALQTPILVNGRLTGGHVFILAAGARMAF